MRSDLLDQLGEHPLQTTLAAALAFTCLAVAFLLVARLVRGAALAAGRALRTAGQALARTAEPLARVPREDLLGYLAAGIATGVAGQGVWRVFRDDLHMGPLLCAFLFPFMELAMLACALRARKAVCAGGAAGVSGAAVWVFTATSAFVSTLHADSFPEAAVRCAAPLIAAALWEQSLGIERRAHGEQRGRIHWRISPERVLVHLGLADPTGRDLVEVDAERHLTLLAIAATRAQTAGTGRRGLMAQRRLRAVLRRAVERTHLSTDAGQQAFLRDQLAALGGTRALLDLTPAAPWSTPDDAGPGEGTAVASPAVPSEEFVSAVSASVSGRVLETVLAEVLKTIPETLAIPGVSSGPSPNDDPETDPDDSPEPPDPVAGRRGRALTDDDLNLLGAAVALDAKTIANLPPMTDLRTRYTLGYERAKTIHDYAKLILMSANPEHDSPSNDATEDHLTDQFQNATHHTH